MRLTVPGVGTRDHLLLGGAVLPIAPPIFFEFILSAVLQFILSAGGGQGGSEGSKQGRPEMYAGRRGGRTTLSVPPERFPEAGI